MSQTRAHSLLEAVANMAVGYWVALLAQIAIFAWLGIPVDLSQNVVIGLWFTGISLARSYLLRRAFNWWSHKERI